MIINVKNNIILTLAILCLFVVISLFVIREYYLIKLCIDADLEMSRITSRMDFIANHASGETTRKMKEYLSDNGDLNEKAEASVDEMFANKTDLLEESSNLHMLTNAIVRDKIMLYYSIIPKRRVFYDPFKSRAGLAR